MEISRKSSDLEPTNSQNFYEQTKSRLTGLFRKIFCLDDQLINDFQPKKSWKGLFLMMMLMRVSHLLITMFFLICISPNFLGKNHDFSIVFIISILSGK